VAQQGIAVGVLLFTPTATVPDDATASAETILVPEQAQVTLSFSDSGDLVLRQTCWPDEDACIVIARENIIGFVDALTDAVGIPSLP
jgi:hypothetical protein